MAPPTSSDAELIRALRAGDLTARDTLDARYRSLLRRLVLASRIAPELIDEVADRTFDAAVAAVTAPGPAGVNFGASLLLALRDELADDPDRVPDPTRTGAGSRAASEATMHDAALASAELIASWQMLLWAVHVEGVELARAAQVAGIPTDEAPGVLRRAEEAIANGVVARALARTDCSHAPFLRLLEQRTVGELDQDASEHLAAHTAHCAGCSATGAWLATFRSSPGVILAAVALGNAARPYLLSAHTAAGTATPLPARIAAIQAERSRGLLVTTTAVLAAFGLLVVAITAPGVSTLTAQLLQNPVPTTAGGAAAQTSPSATRLTLAHPTSSGSSTARSTRSGTPQGDGAGAVVGGPTTVQTTRITGSSSTGAPWTSPALPTTEPATPGTSPAEPTAPSATPAAIATTVTDPSTGSDPTTGSGRTTVPGQTIVPGQTMAPGPTTAPGQTTVLGPTTDPTTGGAEPPAVTAPPVPRPTPTPPVPTTPPVTPPPTAPTTSVTTRTTVTEPAPPLVVRLGDDWSHLEIKPGLGFSRTTRLVNFSDRTSAPVVIVARSSVSLLMALSADGRPCGPIGVLADSVSCTIGPLAPGQSVPITFSAALPLTLRKQTVSVELTPT